MSLRIIDESRQNLLFAFRQLVRQRTFTLVAVLTLALGIGFTTAIFSVVHAVVLRPLPVPDAGRLFVVNEVWRGRPGNVSAGNFVDWRAAAKSFESLAAAQYSSFNLADVGTADAGTAERVIGARVTAAFFDVFGTSPMRGRVFTVAEDEPGREQLVVLSHRLWARRFGADPTVVGKEIRMNGRPYSVLGIMPPSFDLAAFTEELWVPVAFTPERKATHDEHYLTVYGKLRDNVTRQQAQGEMEAIAADLSTRYPRDNAGNTALVQPLMDVIVGGVRQRLLILFGAVAFVLLIACTNVANLLLARGSSRRRELAVRSALGAGRARLVGQLLTESLALGGVGALVGLGLARWGIQLLIAFAPAGVPRLDQATIDVPVLVFALGIALASSLIFGLAPALRASRADLQGSLKDGARQVGASLGQDRVRAALVAVEVALAVLLLVGAGLLIRTSIALQSVHPGFEPGGVLSARLSLPASDYAEPARVIQTFQRVVEETRQLPGVELAAAVTQAPLSAGGNSNGLIAEGQAFDIRNAINSRLRIITLDYFRTLRVPIVEGRGFTDADRRGAPKVMIVSQELARVAWPGQSAIGKRMACCEGGPNEPDWKIVVGVAGDVRSSGLAQAAGPEFYLPIDQVPAVAWDWIQRTMYIVARSAGNPGALAPSLRTIVNAVDPNVPIFDVRSMEERLIASSAPARFNTWMLAVLGAVGLVLAAIGIYGVIAYFVGQRSQEIGVRMALGASAHDVVTLVVRQAIGPVLIGIAAGGAAALALRDVMNAQLYGVSPRDPITLVTVMVVLVTVSLLASIIPARRAVRIDPARALRSE